HGRRGLRAAVPLGGSGTRRTRLGRTGRRRPPGPKGWRRGRRALPEPPRRGSSPRRGRGPMRAPTGRALGPGS
ncbi:MAG: hypothetical protein E6G47_06720, partial [Actinobacteria bacterium]